MPRRFPFLFALCFGAVVFTGVTLSAFGRVQDDQYLYMKTEGLKAFVVGNYADAERYFLRVVEISRATRSGSSDLSFDLNSLAEVYRIRRRWAEAQPLYEEALSILRSIAGSERQTAGVLQNLAFVQNSEGKSSEAERTLQKALTNAEKSVGRNGLAYASILDQLGKLYAGQRKIRKAERMIKESLRIRERYVGPEDPWIEVSLNSLAVLLQFQGKPRQAEPLLRRSLQLIERALGPDHPDVADLLFNLSQLHKELGRYEEAQACLRRALEIRIVRFPAEDPAVIETVFELGKLEMMVGNLREAEPLLQQSLDIRRKVLPSVHSDLALTLEAYSDLMNKLDRSDEATKFADEARRMRNTLKFTRPVAPRKPRY
jgi:tetratricopeptide (TPR) repeat protein